MTTFISFQLRYPKDDVIFLNLDHIIGALFEPARPASDEIDENTGQPIPARPSRLTITTTEVLDSTQVHVWYEVSGEEADRLRGILNGWTVL